MIVTIIEELNEREMTLNSTVRVTITPMKLRSLLALAGLAIFLTMAIGCKPLLLAQAEPELISTPAPALSMAASATVTQPVPDPVIPSPTVGRSAPIATPLSPTPVPPTTLTTGVTTATPSVAVAHNIRVNVRSGPGTDYPVVGLFDSGAQAQVTGRCSDWWQIEYNGASAWVASWVVTASGVDSVPQVEASLASTRSLQTTANSTPIPPLAPPQEVQEARWIDIDLSLQSLTAYEGDTPVRTTLVSTGLVNTPTPEGQFRIWVKFRYDDMEGPGYYLADVPYVMYFHKGYGLHGVFWHGNFGHPMSHGCVNLPTPEAEWLFNWADVGTLVNILAT
jgi:lipoprotein-anchoring transpeptidase ErfK/SrfK